MGAAQCCATQNEKLTFEVKDEPIKVEPEESSCHVVSQIATSETTPRLSQGPVHEKMGAGPELRMERMASELPKERITSRVSKRAAFGRSNALQYRPWQKLQEKIHDPQFSTMARMVEKSAEDRAVMSIVLRLNDNLQQLAPLGDEHLKELVDHAWRRDVAKGTVLMHEGDLSADTFFIIAEGSFEVTSSQAFDIVSRCWTHYISPSTEFLRGVPNAAQTIGKCACIGEISVIRGEPRFATLKALEDSKVWCFSQATFKRIQLQALEVHMDLMESMGVISKQNKFVVRAMDNMRMGLTPRVIAAGSGEKSEEELQLVTDVLKHNQTLRQLVQFSDEHLAQLVDVAVRENVRTGQTLMTQGGRDAQNFYIITEGSFMLSSTEPFQLRSHNGVFSLNFNNMDLAQVQPDAKDGADGKKKKEPQVKTVVDVSSRTCIGELSCLCCTPRICTVIANEPSVVWSIDRANFKIIQMKAIDDMMVGRVNFLNKLEILKGMSQDDKEKVARALRNMQFKEGEIVLTEGEEGDIFYILTEGEVSVIMNGKEVTRLEAKESAGIVQHFGERALLTNEKRVATVKVVSEFANTLVLDQQDFNDLLGKKLAPEKKQAKPKSGNGFKKEALKDLEEVGLLGVTALGPVSLVKSKKTKSIFALRRMNKGLIGGKGLQKSIMREREIFSRTEGLSNFIVRTYMTYNEPKSLCYLFEPALGGQLSAACENGHVVYGNVDHVHFYVAGIVTALQVLHKLKIAHRNVNPDNVLIAASGYPKLIGMSLATKVLGSTFTCCGVPEYVAPEVLLGSGHNSAVDWWSLGCVLFELMAGRSPFAQSHPMDVYSAVMSGVGSVDFPASCAGPVGALIKGLLKQNPVQRLALRQGGVANITNHKWFAGFDWSTFSSQKMKAPYIPTLANDTDVSHFSACKSNVPALVEYLDDGSGWDANFTTA